jgi:hypothetical protein
MANRISPSSLPNPVTALGYDGTDFKALKLDAAGALVTTGGGGVPAAHAESHQDGGSDEVNVAALSGVLADAQDADKIEGKAINIAGLATGDVLRYNAGMQQWLNLPKATPEFHKLTHQSGASDEISVAGLSGELADNQPSTFLKLSDTPATYVGQANKVPYVVTAENALAFALACDLEGLLKLFRSRRQMFCDYQAYAGWTSAVTGTGSVAVALHRHRIITGATSGSTAAGYTSIAPLEMAKAEFTVMGQFETVLTTCTVFLVVTTGTAFGLTSVHTGWYILNGRLWASNGDGANGTQTDTGIDMVTATLYSLRLISNSATPNIKFYVNDVLVATHTTNLPAYSLHRPFFYITNSAASTRQWRTHQMFYAGLDDLT